MKGSWGKEMDYISHLGQIQNTLLCHAMVTILVHVGHHFSALWCILVHFGEPHVRPHDPFMTCSDSYPLSSVHLILK